MTADEVCHEHSGCLRDIRNIKEENVAQWKEIRDLRVKTDQFMTRLNVILGGIVVAVVLLLVNIVVSNS